MSTTVSTASDCWGESDLGPEEQPRFRQVWNWEGPSRWPGLHETGRGDSQALGWPGLIIRLQKSCINKGHLDKSHLLPDLISLWSQTLTLVDSLKTNLITQANDTLSAGEEV